MDTTTMLQYAADVGTLLFALITFLVWAPMTVAAYEAVTGSRDRAGLVLVIGLYTGMTGVVYMAMCMAWEVLF